MMESGRKLPGTPPSPPSSSSFRREQDDLDLVRKRRPRRPRLSSGDIANNGNSTSSMKQQYLLITKFVESVVYGEEDDASAFWLETTMLLREENEHNPSELLPWNVQWRLWLLHRRTKDCHKEKATTHLLPGILAQLQSQVLLLRTDTADREQSQDQKRSNHGIELNTTSADLMDVWATASSHRSNVILDKCWNQDRMLVFWKEYQRFHVLKDLQDMIWNTLGPSEQRCVTEIIHAIDIVTGYHEHSSTIPSDQALVSRCLDDTMKSFQQQPQQQQRQQQHEMKYEVSSETGDNRLLTMDIFRNWITATTTSSSSQLIKDDILGQRAESLVNLTHAVGVQGTRGECYLQLAACIMDRQDPEITACLYRQIPWLVNVHEDDVEATIRGKALCLYLLSYHHTERGDDVHTSTRIQAEAMAKWLSSVAALPVRKDVYKKVSLLGAAQKYLLEQPRKTGITPNVQSLLAKLWEFCIDPSLHVSSSVFLELVETLRDWLPVQPLIALYRSKMQELLQVNNNTIMEAEDGMETEGAEEQHSTIVKITKIVMLCCNDHAASRRDFWCSVFDDEDLIYHTILPLYFWHAMLVIGGPSESITKSLCLWKDACRAIHCFLQFLHDITCQCNCGWESVLTAVPALSELLNWFADLNQASNKFLDSSRSTTIADNCQRFGRIRDTIQKDAIVLDKETGLQLSTFCNSLVRFCQNAKMPLKDVWIDHTVKLLQQRWNGEEAAKAWISGLVQDLCHEQNGRALLPLTATLHGHLMQQLLGQACSTICCFDVLVSEISGKALDKGVRLDIFACILRRTPPLCLFAGCDDSRLDASLAQALSFCSNLAPSSESTQCALLGVALRLDKSSTDMDHGGVRQNASGDVRARCKSNVLHFFQQNIHSFPMSYRYFVELQTNVSGQLESFQADSGLAWWEEVSLDVKEHHKEFAIEADAAITSQRERLAKLRGRKGEMHSRMKSVILKGIQRDEALSSPQQSDQVNEELVQPVDSDIESLSAKESDADDDSSDEILLLDLG